MPPNIEKLIEDTKRTLAEMYGRELNMATAKSVQVALRQYTDRDNVPNENTVRINEYGASLLEHSIKSFKEQVEKILNDLKAELVVEEGTQAKNKYEIVFIKIQSIPFGIIDLQNGDIPIGYQTYMSAVCTGSSSGTFPRAHTGGEQVVREVIVLRPVLEANVQH